jgi:hypothetical protein
MKRFTLLTTLDDKYLFREPGIGISCPIYLISSIKYLLSARRILYGNPMKEGIPSEI